MIARLSLCDAHAQRVGWCKGWANCLRDIHALGLTWTLELLLPRKGIFVREDLRVGRFHVVAVVVLALVEVTACTALDLVLKLGCTIGVSNSAVNVRSSTQTLKKLTLHIAIKLSAAVVIWA